MSLMNRNRDTTRLRTLAHRLRVNLESERRLPSSLNPVPLVSRISQLLDTSQLWVEASGLESEGNGKLHARAQRNGVGRHYMEDLVLTVRQQSMSLTLTRWVKEKDRGYYAGSWNFQEDFHTGQYQCEYSH